MKINGILLSQGVNQAKNESFLNVLKFHKLHLIGFIVSCLSSQEVNQARNKRF